VQLARERGSIHAGHDEEHQPIALIDRVDRHDVWMVELRCCLGFAEEPSPDFTPVREFRGKDLDGDGSLEPFVLRAVDDAHSATADLAVDLIARA
jgi:hypothetical protein